MMYPILCKIKFESLHRVFQSREIWWQIVFSVVANWIVAPFLMVSSLALFFWLGLAWLLVSMPWIETEWLANGDFLLARALLGISTRQRWSARRFDSSRLSKMHRDGMVELLSTNKTLKLTRYRS